MAHEKSSLPLRAVLKLQHTMASDQNQLFCNPDPEPAAVQPIDKKTQENMPIHRCIACHRPDVYTGP